MCLDFEVEEVNEIAADATPESTFALHRLKDETLLLCTAPWHRLDVRIPADIIEEVARIIGYEHVGMTLVRALGVFLCKIKSANM